MLVRHGGETSDCISNCWNATSLERLPIWEYPRASSNPMTAMVVSQPSEFLRSAPSSDECGGRWSGPPAIAPRLQAAQCRTNRRQ